MRPQIATTLVLRGTRILMVDDPYRGLVLPGGHIERGERADVAARRELYEETGLVAALLVDLGTYRTPDHVVAAYYAPHFVGHLRSSPEGVPHWVPIAAAAVSGHGPYVRELLARV